MADKPAGPRIIESTATAAQDMRFALVVSKYHDFVTERLRQGAMAALAAAGVKPEHVTIVRVPGAFEIPTAARYSAETGHFDAIVCLGCLVRGATPHFEVIAAAVAHGLTGASGETGIPMTFGVLTTNSIEEALERSGDGTSNKGWEAAVAAIEMAEVSARIARTSAS
jgi:6,7-dimethyl-8-ribityllumazine synthase